MYPYSTYTSYVGGGPTLLLKNLIQEAQFCAFTLQFQQSTLSSPPTTGTLTFEVTYWLANGKIRTLSTIVPLLSFTQSRTVVEDRAVVRAEVSVRSSVPADTGIPATIILQSLVQGNNTDKAPCKRRHILSEHQLRRINRRDCNCPPFSEILPTLPCPTAALNSTTTTIAAPSFVGTGTNIMYLNPLVCGSPMTPLLTTATLTQGINSLGTQVQLSSASVFRVSFNNVPALLVAGAATLTLTPLSSECTPIAFPVTLTAI